MSSAERNEQSPVLIIGAGPVGLMCAICLAELGVPVEIVDKRIAPTTEWRAAVIHPRAYEVLTYHGLKEALNAVSKPMYGVDWYLKKRLILHLSTKGARTEFPYLLACPQTETERALSDRLSELGIHVQRGWSFVSYESDTMYDKNQDGQQKDRITEGPLTVKLQKVATEGESTDQTITKRVSYLIGCDGGRSGVRKAIGATFDGHSIEYKMLVADTELKINRPDNSRIIAHPGALIAMTPIGRDNYRVVTTWNAAGDQEPTTDVITNLITQRLSLNEATDVRVYSTGLFSLNERHASSFSSKDLRVHLCGDSAHVHSPSGAQGMNTGLQDADNLAWKLALVYHGTCQTSLLTSYVDERLPVAKEVIALSGFLLNAISGMTRMRALVIRILSPLLNLVPAKVYRTIIERMGQLRIRYSNASIAVAEDPYRKRSSWFSFWNSEDLCAPGMRAIDGVVEDLLAVSKETQKWIRLREWRNEHQGSYDVLVFMDCMSDTTSVSISESNDHGNNDNAGSDSDGGNDDQALLIQKDRREFNTQILSTLKDLTASLKVYRCRVPLAIILRHAKDDDTARSLALQLQSQLPKVRVFVDWPQHSQGLKDAYPNVLQSRHSVYLVRPDAYVAHRAPLTKASGEIQKHLDTFLVRV